MKGIILAGGSGTRLLPMTKITNKHLLPVYNKPMVMFPLETLKKAGVTDIMIISGKGHAGHFLELLGSGVEHGVKLSYAVQEKAGGIADALALAEDFADGEPVAVILGDNIFEDTFDLSLTEGAKIFIKSVPDPERFGVAVFDRDDDLKIVNIIEKPISPVGSNAVTGLYIYDATVFDKIKTLVPSQRGELEISDINNIYLRKGQLSYHQVKGFWKDAGTPESLYIASGLVKNAQEVLYNI